MAGSRSWDSSLFLNENRLNENHLNGGSMTRQLLKRQLTQFLNNHLQTTSLAIKTWKENRKRSFFWSLASLTVWHYACTIKHLISIRLQAYGSIRNWRMVQLRIEPKRNFRFEWILARVLGPRRSLVELFFNNKKFSSSSLRFLRLAQMSLVVRSVWCIQFKWCRLRLDQCIRGAWPAFEQSKLFT